MVEFHDGSTLAQASPPTMMIPIALGLAWPDRVPDAAPAVDWTTARDLGVLPARRRGVPRRCAWPARRASRGGTAPAVYNAANEVCVEAFLAGELPFTDIVPTIERVLGAHDVPSTEQELTVDDVLAADAWARHEAAVVSTADEPHAVVNPR